MNHSSKLLASLSLLAGLTFSLGALAHSSNEDTIMINLGNNKKIIIQVENKQDLKTLKQYDINQILQDLSNSVDTAQNSEYLKMEDLTGQKYMKERPEGEATFDTEKFSQVRIDGSFEVDLKQNDYYQVSTNSTDAIKTFKIVGDELIIEGIEPLNGNRKIIINTPEVNSINASDGTRLYVMGFSQPEMQIRMDHAAMLIADINVQKLAVSMDHGAKARLQGFGDFLQLNLDNGALLDAYEYSVENAEVKADHGSIAKVNVIGELNPVLNGSAIVRNRLGDNSPDDDIVEKGIDGEILKNARIKLANYELSVKVDDWNDFEASFENFDKKKVVKTDSVQNSTDAIIHAFNLELGMNNYLQNGKFPDDQPYAVRPWGSWFVGFNSTHRFWISGPLFIHWGKSLSWYNFKLMDNDIRFQETPDGLVFLEDDRDIDPIKSKLTMSYLSTSLIPMLDFSQGRKQVKSYRYESVQLTKYKKRNFRIGIGPYIGYRLSSHTKFVYKDGGDREKEKDRDNFYLNTWRYGLRLQTGYKSMDLFFDYDLNPLFNSKGPDLNAFSFGIIL